jgi:CHAT domain-containing protein/tetratricopeptide (TPR) repeat protein
MSTRSYVVLAVCAASLLATVRAGGWSSPLAQRDAVGDVETLVAKGLYAPAETAARTELERVRGGAGDDSIEAAVASDAVVRVLMLNGKGSLPATIALAEHALAVKQSRLRASDPGLASSLMNLGSALSEAAAHRRAIPLLERAVSLRQNQDRALPLARALDALGAGLVRAGRQDEAIAALRRALTIIDATANGELDCIVTLNHLVLALQQKGDYAAARIVLNRALELRRSANDHPLHVTTLTLLGQQLWFEGSWVDARDASGRAVDLAERTLRPDHPATAVALRYLSATLLDLGDIAQAKSLQERALGMIERSLGPTHHEMSAYLNMLGEINMGLGDYPGARAFYEKALTIAETRLGAVHTWTAGLNHNLALVDARLGDYAGARQRQARAIAIWERVLGPDHPIVALALMQLAAVQREQSAPTEALPLLERALAIRERSLGPDHLYVARTLSDLSATLIQLEKPGQAQDLATRALRILDGANSSESPDLATVLDLYGQLQLSRGDYDNARRYFDRSLAIKQKVFGAAHPVFAETQARLAQTLALLGESAAALKIAAAAETSGREHLRLMLRHLPERQSLNYAASRPRGLDLALSLVDVVRDAPSVSLDAVIRSRALVLDEMAARRSPHDVSGNIASGLGNDLSRARQRLANLVVRGPGDLAPARYAAVLEDARRDSERAERALAERNAVFNAALQHTQIGLDDVQKALPAGSALVSFIRYQRTVFRERSEETAGTRRNSSPATVLSYLAFVVKPGASPVAVQLGPVNTIDTLVARWRENIAGERSERPSGSTRSSRASGTELRKLVWDPVAGALNGIAEVFIVPDGTLSLVPFAALPIDRASFLVEQSLVIHYVSAERDLTSLPSTRSQAAQGLLAIGGPAFDDRTLFGQRNRTPTSTGSSASSSSNVRSVTGVCNNLQQLTFEKLDGSLREVEELARLWTAPRPNDARVLVGRDASELTFKLEASRYRVLHLATHGFFLGTSCDTGPVVRGTRAVGGLSTATRAHPNQAAPENPLLLAGLALAGANRRASARADEDDGILTAEEVASLNLSGVQWAVLSACDTGLGEIKAGEGVFGLRRAFQIAGARTVIMSLWSVEDDSTRSWMRALYEGRFQEGLDTARAVKAASLSVLHERRAKGLSTVPFYWAAFVAAGDWR